ncbi:N,N'-diacetylchitobiose transport system substrate-binding protein [Motilibacter peucedani]|uniref:N,N'-diacetylchitobiose transport system substrate-binding protein n=1 Tax=Motilibacter peucedani TaxID=598650 RepID=A0A420XL60_9ACTN|nr:extracellular solute-binding protein [Motilibacter peucedani]RKS69372.1 N,N'-diacetylchitobiose transport system substrate-binding protein [Motilibacter peucedani]
MKITRLLAVSTVAALALAGCGGSSSPSEPASDGAAAAPSSSAGAQTGGGDKVKVRLWLNGTDTPQPIRDYLKTTFEKENPNAELVIEQQVWDGLVDKLTTALSGSDSPDVVEVGNTQAVAFTSAGAFEDITDKKAELGGDDLLKGFVDAGTYDGKFYAAPYYAGSRLVFYRKDLFKAAGISGTPTTLDEYIADGAKLKAASKTKGFSGLWWPGQDWRNALPFIWATGGDVATEKDGTWTGTLESPESVKGLKMVQKAMTEDSAAAKDGQETDPQVPYCANQVGMLSAPGWVAGSILAPKDKGGCPDAKANLGVFALPGLTADKTAPVFLGGSNLGISAKSQHKDLAYALLKDILSDGYQSQMAKAGLVPAKTSLVKDMGTDEVAQATAKAVTNTKLTPAAPGWANVEADKIMEDLFVKIAGGGDVASLAKAADAKITDALNR